MLKQIQDILEQHTMNCSFRSIKDPSPVEQLLVFLGKDFKEREQILEILSEEQPLGKPHEYYRIQFYFKFPFQVQDQAFSQVASLLHFINQLLDFPGLNLDELHNEISYRYVWLTKINKIDSKLIMSIIGIILFILELFTQPIERVALGTITFNDLLQELVDLPKTKQQFKK